MATKKRGPGRARRPDEADVARKNPGRIEGDVGYDLGCLARSYASKRNWTMSALLRKALTKQLNGSEEDPRDNIVLAGVAEATEAA